MPSAAAGGEQIWFKVGVISDQNSVGPIRGKEFRESVLSGHPDLFPKMDLNPHLLPDGCGVIQFKLLTYYRVRSTFESNYALPSNKI
jgi:hypothetical protein